MRISILDVAIVYRANIHDSDEIIWNPNTKTGINFRGTYINLPIHTMITIKKEKYNSRYMCLQILRVQDKVSSNLDCVTNIQLHCNGKVAQWCQVIAEHCIWRLAGQYEILRMFVTP
jgi:hypothetical protein